MNDSNLRDAIKDMLNTASRENESDTPDYILAEYLMDCLIAYEKAVNKRDELQRQDDRGEAFFNDK